MLLPPKGSCLKQWKKTDSKKLKQSSETPPFSQNCIWPCFIEFNMLIYKISKISTINLVWIVFQLLKFSCHLLHDSGCYFLCTLKFILRTSFSLHRVSGRENTSKRNLPVVASTWSPVFSVPLAPRHPVSEAGFTELNCFNNPISWWELVHVSGVLWYFCPLKEASCERSLKKESQRVELHKEQSLGEENRAWQTTTHYSIKSPVLGV